MNVPRPERWAVVERRGLLAVGALMVAVGAIWIGIALDPRPEAQVAVEFRPFAAAVGVATAIAGVLAIRRQREELVLALIGALTAASFAIGTALLTRPETRWTVYAASLVYGALLFGLLAFRGAFAERSG